MHINAVGSVFLQDILCPMLGDWQFVQSCNNFLLAKVKAKRVVPLWLYKLINIFKPAQTAALVIKIKLVWLSGHRSFVGNVSRYILRLPNIVYMETNINTLSTHYHKGFCLTIYDPGPYGVNFERFRLSSNSCDNFRLKVQCFKIHNF
jgi:hypothetical protein